MIFQFQTHLKSQFKKETNQIMEKIKLSSFGQEQCWSNYHTLQQTCHGKKRIMLEHRARCWNSDAANSGLANVTAVKDQRIPLAYNCIED